MKNKILLTISFLAAIFVISSCLKDDVGIDWTDTLAGKMYAEFPSNGFNSFTIQPVATDQVFKALVNIATDALPTSDITLTFEIDSLAMEEYSDELQEADTLQEWRYQLYPGAVLEESLVIEKGTRNAYVHVTLPRADTTSLSSKYMIPITISAVTGGVVIAENKKTVLYGLPLANKWEGTYKGKGYILRAGDPVLSGQRRFNAKLGTFGPTTVEWTSTHIWGDGVGGVGGIGNWRITINESVTPNTITLVDPGNPVTVLESTYPNRYEPSERTFYIEAKWGSPLGARRETDTLVYYGPL